MIIATRYGIGQTVFYADSINKYHNPHKGVISSVSAFIGTKATKTETKKCDEPDVTYTLTDKDGDFHESILFSSPKKLRDSIFGENHQNSYPHIDEDGNYRNKHDKLK